MGCGVEGAIELGTGRGEKIELCTRGFVGRGIAGVNDTAVVGVS